MSWGTSDAAAPESDSFVAALRSHGYQVQTDPQSGGHTAEVWKGGLHSALLIQGSRLGHPNTYRRPLAVFVFFVDFAPWLF